MIAIVDYNAGNIGSVANALNRLGQQFEVTSDAEKIRLADGVIFPGQGRAGPAMDSLRKAGLDKLLPNLKQPFLGICLGMQLMVKDIEEDNQTGLGILPGKCIRFQNIKPVPHMGWNNLLVTKKLPLLRGVTAKTRVYFVHSYLLQVPDEFVMSETDYGGKFASAVTRDNFYGVQFHPEKSAVEGETILKNFLRLCGEKL